MEPILAGRGQTDKSPKIKMCRIICDNTNGTRSRENIYVHMYMLKMMHENSSAICNGHTQGLSETNTVQENML